MLTVCKITGKGCGYEVMYDFCKVRDSDKYQKNVPYISKILNRFEDKKGKEHLVVMPMSNEPIHDINYDMADKIINGKSEGILFLFDKGYLIELKEVIEAVDKNPSYNIYDSEDPLAVEVYDESVQNYLNSLI